MTDIPEPSHQALRLSQERAAATANGYVMLLVLLASIAGGILAAGLMVDPGSEGLGALLLIVSVFVFLLVLKGFYL
ncbi:MAG: hypothetical protein ACJ8DZ_03270, partial [Allosphingosinicella sp.]